jgi:hypothetical protein
MFEQLSLLPANQLGKEMFPWSRVLGVRGRTGGLDREQSGALSELRWGERLVGDEQIESIANHAHRKACLPRLWVDPRMLAISLGFRVLSVVDMSDGGRLLDGTIYYRVTSDRKQRSFRVAHELAHGLLIGTQHDHADVQALTACILAPRAEVLRCRTITELYRIARWPPSWLLRFRFCVLSPEFRSELAANE